MKIKRVLLYIFLGCVALGAILCSTFSHDHQESYLDIQTVKTDFGITAWLVEDHSLPIISMKFAFKGGSVLDTPELQGLTNVTATMLNQGAGKYDNKAFKKLLNDQNITINFGAGRDSVYGSLKTLTKYKDNAAQYLNLTLTQPRFESEELERIINKEIARIKSALATPSWVTARFINDRAFEGHPYALNAGGTITSLSNMTSEDLKTRSKQMLKQDNLMVSVVGDITPTELKAYLQQIFGDLESEYVENTANDINIQNIGTKYIYGMDIPQTLLRVIWPGIKRHDPDYYAAQVMNYIFGGGGFGSRLMETIREEKGLSYGVYSNFAQYDHANYLGVSMSTQNASAQEALSLIMNEAKLMIETDVSEDELQAAKDYLIGSLPLQFTSSDKISGTMLSLQLDNMPPETLDTRADKINATTKEDIKRLAARFLTPSPLVIAVGQPENINKEEWTYLDEIPNAE